MAKMAHRLLDLFYEILFVVVVFIFVIVSALFAPLIQRISKKKDRDRERILEKRAREEREIYEKERPLVAQEAVKIMEEYNIQRLEGTTQDNALTGKDRDLCVGIKDFFRILRARGVTELKINCYADWGPGGPTDIAFMPMPGKIKNVVTTVYYPYGLKFLSFKEIERIDKIDGPQGSYGVIIKINWTASELFDQTA